MSSLKRETIIYSTSDILRRITGIIMLPIYTQYLTPSDYGVVEMLTMIIGLGQIFFGVRASEAVFRYSMSADETTRGKVIYTGLAITSLTTFVGALLLVLSANYISDFLLGSRDYLLDVKIFCMLVFLSSVEEYGFAIIRLMQKAKLFLIINIFRLILQVGLNVYLIVILDLHVRGVTLSALIAISITCIILVCYILYKIGFYSFEFSWIKKITKYSVPLLVSAFAGFAIGSLDSIFIRFSYGLETVGIYALSKKIALILFLAIWQPFSKSWQGHKYYLYENSEHDKYREVFVQLFFFTIFVAFLMSIFASDIVEIMTDSKFWDAQLFVPLLAVASLLTICQQFLNFGILLGKDTMLLAKIRFVTLVLISFGYAVCIPIWGPWGAASAYCVVMLIEAVLINHYSERYYNMNINWKVIFSGFMLIVAVYLLWRVLDTDQVIQSVMLRSFAIVMALCICVIIIKSQVKSEKLADSAPGV